MTLSPGDRVTFESYGAIRSAVIVEIKPSGVVYARRLCGPLAGRMVWMFREGLTKADD